MNVNRSRTSTYHRNLEFRSRVRRLPLELQDLVLQQYLQGIHARSNARRAGRVILRRARISRGAQNYARHRVRQLRRTGR